MKDETKECLEALQNVQKILPVEIAKNFESDTDGMIYAEGLLNFNFFSGKLLGTLRTLKDLKMLDCNDKIADAINQVNRLGFSDLCWISKTEESDEEPFVTISTEKSVRQKLLDNLLMYHKSSSEEVTTSLDEMIFLTNYILKLQEEESD